MGVERELMDDLEDGMNPVLIMLHQVTIIIIIIIIIDTLMIIII